MKKTLLKAVAVAVFFCGMGGPMLAKALLNEQKWFTADDTGYTNPLDSAPCSGTPMVTCAQLFERLNATSPWTPVIQGGSPVIAYGDRTD